MLGGVLALCACGGDDPEPAKPATPEEQVRAAATKVLNSTEADAKAVCTTLVTERLIDEVYKGDRQACIDSPVNDDEEGDPGKPKVDSVTVEGARADVVSSVEGGSGDGTRGTLLFAREGGSWKLDRFGTDYLRSAFAAAIKSTDEGALSLPEMKTCLAAKAKKMRESQLRRFIYQSIRDDPKVKATTIALAGKCPEPLAKFVAMQIGDALAKDGKKPAYVRCMKEQLAFLLGVTGLADEALKAGDDDLSATALTAVVSGADKNCKDKK